MVDVRNGGWFWFWFVMLSLKTCFTFLFNTSIDTTAAACLTFRFYYFGVKFWLVGEYVGAGLLNPADIRAL